MLDKKQIKQEYKEKVQLMGIYKITNLTNGKVFINKSKNINASLNRFEFGKLINKCLENELIEDFEKYGSDQFIFEIVESLKPKTDPAIDNFKLLEKLEENWIEKLKPFGEKGYNKVPNLDPCS